MTLVISSFTTPPKIQAITIALSVFEPLEWVLKERKERKKRKKIKKG
jgi:hypothetical protein